MNCRKTLVPLMATAALGITAAPVLAQDAAVSPPRIAVLEDVVVTATRQSESVNRVPMSISAVTQEALDVQGVKNVSDLQRIVPGLSIRSNLAGVQSFAIRGVSQAGATAATTGVYLDDVPLQKRNSQATVQSNGTPAPPLFDLERVEVLRGPQGTLFGGSSEGGTVRFITPQPSLTEYSAKGRAEIGHTEDGEMSYEGGFAAGGPLAMDKVGFRIMVYGRRDGGYIDLLDPYSRANLYPDANSSQTLAARAALRWDPDENTKVTLSIYGNTNRVDSIIAGAAAPIDRTLAVPSACYTRLAAGTVALNNNQAPVVCPAVIGANLYVRPAQTFGPFPFQSDQNIVNGKPENATTRFWAPSLTVERQYDQVNAKSITSYINDYGRSVTYSTTTVGFVQGFTDRSGNYYQPGSTLSFTGTTANTTTGAVPFSLYPGYQGPFAGVNKRDGFIQEFRFSSAADARPFSWVAGLYYSHITTDTTNSIQDNIDGIASALFGYTSGSQRYAERITLAAGQTCASLGLPAGTLFTNVAGACLVGLPLLPGGLAVKRDQELTDTDMAAFGEANYWLTDTLKLTGGIRFSTAKFKYSQIYAGPYSGSNTPSVANTGITLGETKESPITPKVGVSYQASDRTLLYANAAKGYRAGGVNVPLAPGLCSTTLANLGLSLNAAPATYESDSVWSYEAGGKFRVLDDTVQLNASVYRTDWKNVQQAIALTGCAIYTVNVGSAISQGFDLSVAGQIVPGLTGNLDVGYNDASYTSVVTGPTPTNTAAPPVLINDGDKLPVSPWTVSLGVQYDARIRNLPAFVRADYRYTSDRLNGTGPGTASFAPDSYRLPSTTLVNARAGISISDDIDLSVFVNNLLNSNDALDIVGGRGQCAAGTGEACGTFSRLNPFVTTTTFRPRAIGLQLEVRY